MSDYSRVNFNPAIKGASSQQSKLNPPPKSVVQAFLQEANKPAIGQEKAFIKDLKPLTDATGSLFTPLPIYPYEKTAEETQNNKWMGANDIRQWVKDATQYHGVPHTMLAGVLENENPIREEGVKGSTHNALQFTERTLTTLANWADDSLGDIVPDRVAGSSTGIANMSRKTLKSAAQYSIDTYNKNPIPDPERYRVNHWDSDTRMAGRDTKADLYYAASHLRQLIDNEMGVKNFDGGLNWQQTESIISRYNGTGSGAKAYGKRAVEMIHKAEKGRPVLNFYHK